MAEWSGTNAHQHNDPSSLPVSSSGSHPAKREPPGLKPPAVETPFPIIGIGASAGGLDAVTQLLQALPSDLGVGLVLVLRLDPARESMLAELLSRVTSMRVQQVVDDMPVAPNQLYVAPLHADAVIADGMLKLMARPEIHRLHMPIDRFFRSLAQDQGPHAIGIILSGAGSDGALGAQAIKAYGGLTFAQDVQTAPCIGMPHSAIMHGAIDVIRTPQGIAQELTQIVRHPYVATLPVLHKEALILLQDEEAWGRILKALQRARGINFAAYRPSAIARRIARRMALYAIERLDAYAQYLETHRDELEALYHDLLIKATAFFRDPDSFEVLKREVLPRLLREHPVQRPIRIWVPGCATGEEVYSTVICVLEYLGEEALRYSLRLFATDLDEVALAKARQGLYIENIALDVSPERLRRFFGQVNQHYQVIPAIRELCVFAKHNLYQDPPFSNLDLISCRHVLTYLEPAMQRRVMPLLHYALQPNGMLTLGPSETVGPFTDLFSLEDSQHNIYTKKPTALPATVDFSLRRREADDRAPSLESAPEADPLWPTVDVYREADHMLLSRYAPAAVLVNEQMDILHFRGNTDRYLRPAPGKATFNLFRMVRGGLLSDLRAALERVKRTGTEAIQAGVRFRYEEDWREVTIRVTPLALPPPTISHYLIVFEGPVSAALQAHEQGLQRQTEARQEANVEQTSWVHQELEASRRQLQALVEQHEAATEELRAANEEVLSSNEELQSTNEELETAKEELQSMNEELVTTNDELIHRNHELTQANNDLSNLFSSVNLPVIMVGNDLRIRRFTAMAEQVLNLIHTDVGRPIGHLQLNLAMPDLEEVILQVIDTVAPQEREVHDREGHWYSLRIRPYRTAGDTIEGAVLLFIDIDSLKDVDRLTKLLEDVQRARDYAERIVQTVPESLLILDQTLRVRTANQAFYQTFHVSPEETEQRVLYQLGNGQWDIPRLRELLEQIIPQYGEVRDFEVAHAFDSIGLRTMRLNARRLMQEDPCEALILLAIEDITEIQRSHDHLQGALTEKELLLRELHHRVKNNLQLVSSLLGLQSNALKDQAVQQAFVDSQRRIQSMALVHELLSRSSGLSRIDMRAYIQRLAMALFETYAPAGRIGLNLQVEDVSVDIDTAIPCALVLTELLSNALQHAFPVGQKGEVSITWHVDADDYLLLRVQDTGIGMPVEVDFAHTNSLGMTLVRALAGQLGGRIQVDKAGGTAVTLRFPSVQARDMT